MTKVNKQIQKESHAKLDAGNELNLPGAAMPEKALSPNEQELVQEILRALRAIRFGSVVITVHDGHVVEIQRTERIRRGAAKQP